MFLFKKVKWQSGETIHAHLLESSLIYIVIFQQAQYSQQWPLVCYLPFDYKLK